MLFKKNGFTLVEIIVTMVIIGILAAVAIPVYTNIICAARVTNANNYLNALVVAQKVYALNHNGQFCGTTLAVGSCNATSGIKTDLNLSFDLPLIGAWWCTKDIKPMCAVVNLMGVNDTPGFGLFMTLNAPITSPNPVYCGPAGWANSSFNPCCGLWQAGGASSQAAGTSCP